jgi:hypothetical protein
VVKVKKVQRPELDLDTEALAALEEARGMPRGPERTEAMKKAGLLRNAAAYRAFSLRSAEGRQSKTALVGGLSNLQVLTRTVPTRRLMIALVALDSLPADAGCRRRADHSLPHAQPTTKQPVRRGTQQ